MQGRCFVGMSVVVVCLVAFSSPVLASFEEIPGSSGEVVCIKQIDDDTGSVIATMDFLSSAGSVPTVIQEFFLPDGRTLTITTSSDPASGILAITITDGETLISLEAEERTEDDDDGEDDGDGADTGNAGTTEVLFAELRLRLVLDEKEYEGEFTMIATPSLDSASIPDVVGISPLCELEQLRKALRESDFGRQIMGPLLDFVQGAPFNDGTFPATFIGTVFGIIPPSQIFLPTSGPAAGGSGGAVRPPVRCRACVTLCIPERVRSVEKECKKKCGIFLRLFGCARICVAGVLETQSAEAWCLLTPDSKGGCQDTCAIPVDFFLQAQATVEPSTLDLSTFGPGAIDCDDDDEEESDDDEEVGASSSYVSVLFEADGFDVATIAPLMIRLFSVNGVQLSEPLQPPTFPAPTLAQVGGNQALLTQWEQDSLIAALIAVGATGQVNLVFSGRSDGFPFVARGTVTVVP